MTPMPCGQTPGKLYAFVPGSAYATVNDYFDFPTNSSMSISGRFIEVPHATAYPRNADVAGEAGVAVRRASLSIAA